MKHKLCYIPAPCASSQGAIPKHFAQVAERQTRQT